MLTRLNILRRGYCLSNIILINSRTINLTSSLANVQKEPIPPTSTPKKDPLTRSPLSASDLSDIVFKRLNLHAQRGVVKALVIGSGVVVISTILFVYVFRKPLKNQTVAQVADVAKSSLEQDSVKQQVNNLSQELIKNLLSDPNILSKALEFLEHVMDDPTTKQTLIRLLQRLMTDPNMQEYVSEFTSKIIYDVMKKPETEIQLAQLFRRAILQKDNQDALYILLKEFTDSQKTKDVLNNLASEVTHHVLNDEDVKLNATRFLTDILNDTNVQQQSGDFAWNAVKKALKPKWFTSRAQSIDEKPKSDDVKVDLDLENSIILPKLG